MAPPPEVAQPFVPEYKKNRPAKVNIEKAEITPMIEVDSEENRIVFEGLVFEVEQKTTKTGRVIINFKMTDYTSSFTLQKWAKNEEEAQKFDMVKRATGAGARQCGDE